MEQKIIKTGNSLALTIPNSVVKTFGLRPGLSVSTEIDFSRGEIKHRFTSTGQLPLFKKGMNT